jgi:hypothetical protein
MPRLLKMRFSYSPYEAPPSPADESRVVWRPELKVMVGGAAQGVPFWGLLDVGATDCVLPYEVAGLVKAIPCAGKWSLADYTGKDHEVEYGKVNLRIQTSTHTIQWPAIVAFDRDRDGIALWGRCGFLNYFSVTFNGPQKHFTIRLRPPWPSNFKVTRNPRGRSLHRRRGATITRRDQGT